MEISSSVLEGLVLASDTTHIPDKCFKTLVDIACQGVLTKDLKNSIAIDSTFQGIDQAVLKEAYASIVDLLIEAAKHDAAISSVSAILEDCKYSPDRITTLGNIFQAQKPYLQLLLGSTGTSLPHIVDVNWRLDYYIKNNHLERVNEPVYLIALKTEVPGCTELKEVQFSCSQEQLQDLVGKLKDAVKTMEKISQM